MNEKTERSHPLRCSLLRPTPPSPSELPAGWLDSVKESAPLEYLFMGLWWEVKLLKRLPPKGNKPTRLKVVAEKYGVTHNIEDAGLLRPGFKWSSGRTQWATR